MTRTLPDPNTLDWGSMSKSEFKRTELAYELADEDSVKHSYNKTYRTLPLKTVTLTEALAVAYAAHRINGNTYVKHTQRYSEPENKTLFANKELVRYYWEKKNNTTDAKWLPSDFVMFEPTEDDWFTVYTQAYPVVNDEGTTASKVTNFTGNYVWVRAVVESWTDGVVQSVLLNH